ncbi:MDR family MFS transporter [Plantactinospora sp. KBS50]|uniref:MDR family MFS transporter n=1 Tax=Plantactinospora sp. KBS50 TaxID=2024580 RepID=UPI000BAACA91|nr:MDR family MFS transporter [Plantactinospora sp. KBS50]ASW56761.1 MFS transporter [Plantactinospora sp. KBS50]
MAATTDGTTATVAPERRRITVVFTALAMAMFLASLDQTIVATALPEIAGDVGGLDQLSWIIIVYHLASAASTPLWGRISDLYGRKRLLVAAVTVFLAGSALCGLAQNLIELVAFRAVQGLGAGGMMTLSMAVIADLVAARERGRYQGYLQLVFALAGVVGPVLGGLIVDGASWRWVFYVNLPVGALALGVIVARLRLPAARARRSVDYPGAALLVGSVLCLLLVVEWAGRQYAWGSAPVLLPAVAGLLMLLAFVLWERRAAEPILPPRLFRSRVFLVVTATLFLVTGVMFAVVIFVPLFLQVAAGASATRSGLLLLPMTVGITVSTMTSGRLIARTGRYRHFPIIGLAIVTVSVFLLARVTPATSLPVVMAVMALFGTGFGLITQVLVLALQNGADRRDIGVATASANFFRSLGGSVGAAVFGALFAAVLSGRLARTLPAGAGVDARQVQAGPERLRELPEAVQAAVAAGVAHAVDAVFLLATPVAAVALLVVLFLRERPLRGPGAPPDQARGPGAPPDQPRGPATQPDQPRGPATPPHRPRGPR